MADRYNIEQVSLGRYDLSGPDGRVIESFDNYNSAYNRKQQLSLGYDQGPSSGGIYDWKHLIVGCLLAVVVIFVVAAILGWAIATFVVK